MAISEELQQAILAMDVYNRGYNAGLELGTTSVGKADFTSHDLPAYAQAAGFYAAAYSWNGKTVISYRGTDSALGSDKAGGSDILNGWAAAGHGCRQSMPSTRVFAHA